MMKSGQQHIASLRDGRSVFLNGRRVEDVTTHPAYRNAVGSVAGLYDFKRDPAHRSLMNFTDADGDADRECDPFADRECDFFADRECDSFADRKRDSFADGKCNSFADRDGRGGDRPSSFRWRHPSLDDDRIGHVGCL